jgi:hypothetical protein
MEVHPPEHAIHTWRDFLIHMGTICLGLLIAIGLEQSVESLHRHNERRALQRQLLEEAEANDHRLAEKLAYGEAMYRWFAVATKAVEAASPEKDQIVVTLPQIEAQATVRDLIAPSQAVWDGAKASGMLSLLPSAESQIYARINYEAERVLQFDIKTGEASDRADVIFARYNMKFEPGQKIGFPATHRDEVLDALHAFQIALDSSNEWAATYKGANDAALHHVSSVDAMYPFVKGEEKREAQAVETK